MVTEIQSRRQERKRRTTANPVYSGAVFEPEVDTLLISPSSPNLTTSSCLLCLSLLYQYSPACVCVCLLSQRKKSAVTYLNTPLHQGTRKRGQFKPQTSLTAHLHTHLFQQPGALCSACVDYRHGLDRVPLYVLEMLMVGTAMTV